MQNLIVHLMFAGETHAVQQGADVAFDLRSTNSEQLTPPNELVLALHADPNKLSDSAWADSSNWHADGSIAKSKLHPLALVGSGGNAAGGNARSRRGWFKVYNQHAANGRTAQRKAAFAEVLVRLTVEMQAIKVAPAPSPARPWSTQQQLHPGSATGSPTVWF